MEFTGKQLKKIHAAFCKSFVSRQQLAQFLRYELNERLDEIASSGNLSEILFDLICWAEVNGKVGEILQAAKREYPNNIHFSACLVPTGKPVCVEDCSKTEMVQLTLSRNFEEFTEQEQKKFLSAIGMLLETETNISIVTVQQGSVRLTIKLSSEELEKLERLFQDGALHRLGVAAITNLSIEFQQDHISTNPKTTLITDKSNEEAKELSEMNRRSILLPELGDVSGIENRSQRTYNELVGIDKHLSQLVPRLSDINGPNVVSLEGIGGIGKTTLADALFQNIAHNDASWKQFAWIGTSHYEIPMSDFSDVEDDSFTKIEEVLKGLCAQLLPKTLLYNSLSKSQMISLLKQNLSEHKSLIIIDNLETIKDAEGLLALLYELANPSRFIVTSRERLNSAPNLFQYQLSELNQNDSFALLRRIAEISNLPFFVEISDEALYPAYTTVGGNPLALLLLMGQLYIQSLNEILNDFTEARGEAVQNLYTFIYRRAWEYLSETAKQTFIGMILVTDHGDTVDELMGIMGNYYSGADELQNALEELVKLNLVNSTYGLNEQRYSTTNLTRSFLHKQVVYWA